MFKFLKKDSFILGIILGLLMPAICIGILYLLNITVLVNHQNNDQPIFKLSTIFILGLIPNAIALRLYLVNLKADKTGRGILFDTFIFAIIFLIIYYKF